MINKPLHLFLASITVLASTFQIASPIISASKPASRHYATNTSQRSKKVNHSIGGISVGTTEKEIRAKWGKPIQRKQLQGGCGDGVYVDIEYQGAKLNLVGSGNEPFVVQEMSVISPTWRTDKGVKVGDSIERAKKYYRLTKFYRDADKTYVYGVVNSDKEQFPSLGFTVNKYEKITKIGVSGVPIC